MYKTALIIVIIALQMSACATSKFHSSQEKNTARISFSSMMPNMPELSIGLKCKSYLISNDMIEKREPDFPSKIIFNIPTEKEISLYYENIEIGAITYIPVTKCSSNPTLGCRIDLEEHHTADTCSINIAFTPEKDKEYEVFFGATRTNECHIFVKEITNSLTAPYKKFKNIQTDKSAC